VPKRRSKVRRMRATVMAGKAMIIRNEVTSVIQTKTGMRMKLMPGARRLMIVTMKLRAAITEETPATRRPRV
jgi:hypothetical protein